MRSLALFLALAFAAIGCGGDEEAGYVSQADGCTVLGAALRERCGDTVTVDAAKCSTLLPSSGSCPKGEWLESDLATTADAMVAAGSCEAAQAVRIAIRCR